MFELTAAPVESALLQARLAGPEAGAVAVFEGRVRNHHLGRAVTRLDYEAFEEMAQREGEAIVAEALRIYPEVRLLCVHRTGILQVGDTAVWIGVASPHRHQAFAACRYVIEELKLRLPIWKKEHHPGAGAEWVNCTAEAPPPVDPDYHARQLALPEVGAGGQARLAAARVLVVGIGGLGCPAALYLAGAGIGRLTLVDSGRVERSNLHRQVLFSIAEIGAPKAWAAAARLRQHNPAVQAVALEQELTAGNARALVAGQDVVLDCSDNFATRFVVHDACLAAGVPLVQAAVHRFEGTLDVFRRGAGGCLHCLWLGRTAADLDSAGNCAGGPVFAPAVGVLGVMQAAEAIKILLGLEGAAPRQTRLVNLLDGTQLAIDRPARADCPACGRAEDFSPAAPAAAAAPLVVTAGQAAAFGPTARVVFLAESGETAPAAGGAIVVAAQDLARLRELASQGLLVLTCRHGLRSAAMARLLRTEGLEGVHVLTRESDLSRAIHDA